MNVLAVAGHTANIKDHGHGLYATHKLLPGIDQFLPSGGVILLLQGIGQRGPIGQHHTVEGQAQELGEARLARAIKARDPRGRKLGTAALV